MSKEIVFTVADFVAEIVLNRPEKHNAVTPAMAAALQDACAAARHGAETRRPESSIRPPMPSLR